MPNKPIKIRSGRFSVPLDRIFEQGQRSRSGSAHIRFLPLILLVCAVSASAAPGPQSTTTATVTFYAKGSNSTTGLPGSKHGIFYGQIFDSSKPLVSFYEGFVIHNGRFLTLKLVPGLHDFVATDRDKPKDEQHISVDLQPGKQYFFRAQDESSGFVIVEWRKARLDAVDCNTAHFDAGNAKPLKPRHASAEVVSERTYLEELPPCQ